MPAARPRYAADEARLEDDPLALAIASHARQVGRAADAIRELADAHRAATEQRAPVDHFVGGLSDRLDAFCQWFRRWRWPIALSIPGVLTAIGAITPNAAASLAEILKALGAS
jgi:hypothetical protein